MTKIDEHAVVPPPGADARTRLAEAFDQPGVVSARLFGSHATGKAGPLSDVDVAVWLDPRLELAARHRLQLRLINAASAALQTDEVEIVVLNDSSPLLRHRALRDGVALIERDARMRVRLETESLLEYLDTAPLRAEIAAGVRRRLANGSFGRR